MIVAWEFVKRNWEALAIIAIVAVVFIRIEILKSERDDALATIAGLQQEAIKRNAEVEVSNQLGLQAVARLENQYNAKINELLEVSDHDKKTINDLRAGLSSRLRKQSESYTNQLSKDVYSGPPGNDSDSVPIGQSEPPEDFYRKAYLGAIDYIETLEQAGAVCAADFNFCREYVLHEQDRIGVYTE